MGNKAVDSNPILDFALDYQYPTYSVQKGNQKVVAFGDHSHKCPIYLPRIPPCITGCPAGEDIRGYHNLLRGIEKSDNRWKEAWKRVVETNPFPAIMGRICPYPCESECNRRLHDESVGINAVEQVIGDYGIHERLHLPAAGAASGKRVAIIGGGPAGLSCAYQLRRSGHAVTIYEANDKLGGMVRYGIMGYRVDRKILDHEIQRILDLGLETKLGVRIGSEISLDQLEKEYDALFVAVGAQAGFQLSIPGFEEHPNTTNAIDFLKNFEQKKDSFTIGKRVLVVGDGNVAMDVARLALRLGSEAEIISAVPSEEMGCFPNELEDAVVEGATIHYLVGAIEVLEKKNEIRGLKCVKMEKKQKGEADWDSPIPFFRYKKKEGDEVFIEGDMVVAAIGQTTIMKGLESLTEDSLWLKTDKNFRVVGTQKIFGGGDAIRVDLIATAVGHGRLAAESINRFLNDIPFSKPGYQDVIDVKKLSIDYFPASVQQKRSRRSIEKIAGDFDEILETLSLEKTVRESERCMSCGLCFECNQCLVFCPQQAITKFPENPIGEVMFTHYSACVGCHICSLSCPSGYIQMGMGDGL